VNLPTCNPIAAFHYFAVFIRKLLLDLFKTMPST